MAEEVIAVNQDDLGVAGDLIWKEGPNEVCKRLSRLSLCGAALQAGGATGRRDAQGCWCCHATSAKLDRPM